MDYNRLYVLRTSLKGFGRNSAEMQMVAEVAGLREEGKEMQAYLDSEFDDQHNLLEGYCGKYGIQLKTLINLEQITKDLSENKFKLYALVTNKEDDELKEFFDKINREKTTIKTEIQIRDRIL